MEDKPYIFLLNMISRYGDDGNQDYASPWISNVMQMEYTGSTLCDLACSDGIGGQAWGKLYEYSIIYDGIRFGRGLYEDVGFWYQVAMRTGNAFQVIPDSVYIWRRDNQSSLTRVLPDVGAIYEAVKNLNYASKYAIKVFRKNTEDEEIWKRYGHHDSFYGFYVSEESGGSLDNWERTEDMRRKRKQEIVTFFREFKSFCGSFAPSKPVMLATNSFGVAGGLDTYPELLGNLDILCPFGFARMPEGDMTGKEAAEVLQELCDNAGSHLWFDLEAFLFYEDSSLYPRDIEGIIGDLTFLDNFEKVLCYQFPGVFSDPEAAIRVGEEKTEKLFNDYREYLDNINSSN